MTQSIEDIYDEHDIGTPAFVQAMMSAQKTLTSREIVRICWKARTAADFVRIRMEENWWHDDLQAVISTVEVPAINGKTFESLYKGTREMRDAGCDVRTTEEVFRRMLVVWCAQNDIDIDEDLLSYDDLQAYKRHRPELKVSAG